MQAIYCRAAMGEGGGGVSEGRNRSNSAVDVDSFHLLPRVYPPYTSHTCIPLQPITFSPRDFLFLISFFFFFFSYYFFLGFDLTQHISHTQPTDDNNSNTIHNRETHIPRLLFCLCTFSISACGTYSRLT